jgi:hypothetical protein
VNLDETSLKKNHNYRDCIIDTDFKTDVKKPSRFPKP